jgi:signal transduction histidine kinase
LVENALEHGIAPLASGGQVEIVARVEGADPDTAWLHLEIRDDGAGLREGHREGVGLSHVRKRLAQLYPGRHRFALEPNGPEDSRRNCASARAQESTRTTAQFAARSGAGGGKHEPRARGTRVVLELPMTLEVG